MRSTTAEHPPLPRTVIVCGHRVTRSTIEMDAGPREVYRGWPARHCAVSVEQSTATGHWRGQWWLGKARGTRGSLTIDTHGVYTDPRRCAEALTRLVHGWNIAEYGGRP